MSEQQPSFPKHSCAFCSQKCCYLCFNSCLFFLSSLMLFAVRATQKNETMKKKISFVTNYVFTDIYYACFVCLFVFLKYANQSLMFITEYMAAVQNSLSRISKAASESNLTQKNGISWKKNKSMLGKVSLSM